MLIQGAPPPPIHGTLTLNLYARVGKLWGFALGVGCLFDDAQGFMTEPRPDKYDEDVIFKYHRPDADDASKFVAIRDKAGELALLLRELCPPGRELALARTKLEEVVMWANAGIARAPARAKRDG